MGLEDFVTSVFLGESKTLNKRWIVQAQDIEDATGKVVSYCREELAALEAADPGTDVDIDLRFMLLHNDVSEI